MTAGRKIDFMSKLYSKLLKDRGGSTHMTIASGKINFVQQLMLGVYASADLRDDKNVYMAHFGTRDDREVCGLTIRCAG